ncbi:MAG: LysM peptidoglycan-binding domain-containing protein [Peptococcia bacterium]
MSSTKIVSKETYEELSKGIHELLEREEQLAAQLELTKDRLDAAEEAVDVLRYNCDAIEKLLKKDITILKAKDRTAAKVKKRLRTLYYRTKKSLHNYELSSNKSPDPVLTPEESATLLTSTTAIEDAFQLLTDVEILRENHIKNQKLESKRLIRFIIILIVLPIAGFIIGSHYSSYTVSLRQTPIIEKNNGFISSSPEGDTDAHPNEKPTEGSLEAPTEQPVEEENSSSEARIYTVVEGDTLSGIAKNFYGAGKEWERIYQANIETLPDPHKLSIGQELIIP